MPTQASKSGAFFVGHCVDTLKSVQIYLITLVVKVHRIHQQLDEGEEGIERKYKEESEVRKKREILHLTFQHFSQGENKIVITIKNVNKQKWQKLSDRPRPNQEIIR